MSRLWCVAAEVPQGSLTQALRGLTETKLPVYPHQPAEVSHSGSVCVHSLLLWSVSCLICQYVCVKNRMKMCLVPLSFSFIFFVVFFVLNCWCRSNFLSSASVYVGLWSCVSLPAHSKVWGIIPVCWQSRRTEGSEYADLNPLRLNCHLEGREEDDTKMKLDVKKTTTT